MKLIQRARLSDEVQRYVTTNEEIDESFAVLNAATDWGAEHDEPMTLEQALKTIRQVADQVEAIG